MTIKQKIKELERRIRELEKLRPDYPWPEKNWIEPLKPRQVPAPWERQRPWQLPAYLTTHPTQIWC